jgi:hypothetical protein
LYFGNLDKAMLVSSTYIVQNVFFLNSKKPYYFFINLLLNIITERALLIAVDATLCDHFGAERK